MTPKKVDVDEPGPGRDPKSLESFMSAYLGAYREYISGKDMDEIHTPQFFKAYPFSADIYELTNGAVCAMFKKASRTKFSALDGDFEDIMSRMKEQNLDFMLVFPPFTEFTDDEAGRLARTDADRDLKSSRRLEMLTAAETHISGIHDDIQSVADLNPWLDQQAAEQRKKLDRARELIQELYREVDISREERFSDYMRQLSEVMALDRGEVEEMTGEMELRMEMVLEGMEARLTALEATAKDLGKDAGLAGSVQMELSDMSAGLDKLQASFNEISRNFKDIEKEFKVTRAEFSEVKETVQRDGKRTFNLNERVTDLERQTGELKRSSGKDPTAAVRALEGRLNVMEKDLKSLSKKSSRYDAAMAKPVVVESPVVETVEMTPDGATVKKTVKKTTTRKTTRSK